MRLFLHVCCAPCATEVIERLKEKCMMTLFFYNPCIWPDVEYLKREASAQKLADATRVPLIVGTFEDNTWKDATNGLEKEPEGGKRCLKCYELRLRETAKVAKEHGFNVFGTTLTISPHKNAKKIIEIGKRIAAEEGIEFLQDDFSDGFKQSIELSKKYNLYRQNYCGCEYSKKA